MGKEMARKGKMKHIDLEMVEEVGREVRGWGKSREGK